MFYIYLKWKSYIFQLAKSRYYVTTGDSYFSISFWPLRALLSKHMILSMLCNILQRVPAWEKIFEK